MNAIQQAIDALDGVIRVADRATAEFDAARAAITALQSVKGEAVAWGNRDELDAMLDDRSASIVGRRDGFHQVPLYDQAQQPEAQPTLVSDEMVNRFLGWKLPKDFSPDCGVSFDKRGLDHAGYPHQWPIGTNLLTAEQARAMLEYVLHQPTSSNRPTREQYEKMIAETGDADIRIGGAATQRCEDCGDAVPKAKCYCRSGCMHEVGHAAAPQQPAAQAAEPMAERVHKLVNAGDFPGMSEAFESHVGSTGVWVDPAWRDEASLWAAAWKKATHPQPVTDERGASDIAVERDQAFEVWFRKGCPVGGVNARLAARAAWHAALAWNGRANHG